MGIYREMILPRLLDLTMRHDRHVPYRQRLLARAQGRVLEIGAGSGLNLPFYRDAAAGVVALEPHRKLLAMARRRHGDLSWTAIEGSALAIPLANASVDTVVSTWTMCSIPDVAQALAEARRILKPGGRLLFVEHGLSPDSGVRRWQNRLNPAWRRVAGGCNLNRPIPEIVRQAGFEVESLEAGYMEGPKPLTYTYEGLARPR